MNKVKANNKKNIPTVIIKNKKVLNNKKIMMSNIII